MHSAHCSHLCVCVCVCVCVCACMRACAGPPGESGPSAGPDQARASGPSGAVGLRSLPGTTGPAGSPSPSGATGASFQVAAFNL